MILEGIVTTTTPDGTPHLAPMGPRINEAGRRLLLRPFPSSKTFRYLKRFPTGVFHLTDDVLLLARAAVGKIGQLPALRPALTVPGSIIVDACRIIEFRVLTIDEHEPRIAMDCEIVRTESLRDFIGFNRAKNAVLEAAILATRFSILDPSEISNEFRKLRIIVDKTAGERELEAMAFLENEWSLYQGNQRP